MKRNCARFFLIFVCGIVLMQHFGVSSSASSGEERRELWTGSLYTSTYRAGVCIKSDGEVYGALYLRQANGEVDRYTITGKVDGEHITARHHSGHEFKGRFVSEDTVQGKRALKNGHKLDVRAARGPEPEVDEFCRLVRQE
jgi:hypothetical protein